MCVRCECPSVRACACACVSERESRERERFFHCTFQEYPDFTCMFC